MAEFDTDVEQDRAKAAAAPAPASNNGMNLLMIGIGLLIAIQLFVIIGLDANNDDTELPSIVINNVPTEEQAEAPAMEEVVEVVEVVSNVPNNKFSEIESIFASPADNVCDGEKVLLENVDCIHVPGPQAGGNVTKGYKGLLETSSVPLLNPYWMEKMCPINVHWHAGTEHYSVGEYDENGNGPNGNIDAPANRKLAEGERAGFRCHHYNADDARFTTEYDWKHCVGMQVGETYEVHWPHSAAGACGTVNQYQTPFYDGVFCTEGILNLTKIWTQVGVQAQIYTIVNDEAYFYPDMMRGWIVDGEYGSDIHYYTGSTTGTSRSNEICSSYTPITWQVDRKCQLISASSFDKLCYDMKLQRDDMTDDLYAHGSRELVADKFVANNGVRMLKQVYESQQQELPSLRSEAHVHHHDDHDHHHHDWY